MRFAVLERSVALGMTNALAWQVLEYVTFVTRSVERSTAHRDTIADLTLDWVGTTLAAGLEHSVWRQHLPVVDDGTKALPPTPVRGGTR